MKDSDSERIERESPLLAFSLFTHVQAVFLESFGKELLDRFKAWEGNVISDYNVAYGHFWLWLLGAYEMLRTLDQHGEGCSDELRAKTRELKQYLANMRIPFAKQELRGCGTPVFAEPCPVDVNCDLIFRIRGERYSAVDSINRFNAFLEQISLEDVRGEGH